MAGEQIQGHLVGGRYRLASVIGRGGMGTVWQAHDQLLGREVAIKEVLLPPELDDHEREVLRQRAIREARAAGRLSHPNVVTVHDVLEEGGRPWIVMELMPSRSLADIVREDGPLPPKRVAEIGLDVLAALGAAHSAGVLHRDVKPSNVLIAEDGRVVLTDFGIANVEGDPSLTSTGLLLGAPAYMAPERALGEEVRAEADLWSLGATLYTAVEGRPPFDAGGPMPTLAAVVTQEPAPMERAGPLRPVIEGLLRKNPADRLRGADAWLMLREVANEAPTATRREQPVPADAGAQVEQAQQAHRMESLTGPPRRPPWVLPAGLVALALVVATLLGLATLRTPGPAPQATPPEEPLAQAPAGNEPAPPASEPVGEAPSQPAPEPSAPEVPAPGGLSSGVSGQEVPDGFRRYEDPTGFSLAIPEDWEVSRDGQLTYVREPGSARLLLIDQTDDPREDPVADWERQEEAGRGAYRDYQRIRIEAVDYFRAAADWEFTYTSANGRTHVLNRGFVTGDDRAYALYWSTPDSRWEESRGLFEVFAATFQPAS